MGTAKMDNIIIKTLSDNGIDQCRDLCNELMAFQKSKAFIAPEVFDYMNFDTRLVASYNNAEDKYMAVASDVSNNDVPVAYVFATIESTVSGDKTAIPDWAPKTGEMLGFYPGWAPERVGVLNHLYIRDAYRGSGLGKKLLTSAMEWIWSYPDIDTAFVYISNGNDAALDFYQNNGFTRGHSVFGGFITAAYCRAERKGR